MLIFLDTFTPPLSKITSIVPSSSSSDSVFLCSETCLSPSIFSLLFISSFRLSLVLESSNSWPSTSSKSSCLCSASFSTCSSFPTFSLLFTSSSRLSLNLEWSNSCASSFELSISLSLSTNGEFSPTSASFLCDSWLFCSSTCGWAGSSIGSFTKPSSPLSARVTSGIIYYDILGHW